MRILISGASGLIGTALCSRLTQEGHELTRLVRPPATSGAGTAAWDPAAGTIDAAACEGHDAVVHLAGESIAEGRWNDAKKARIRESRVQGTTLLASTLAGLERRPAVFVSGSAIGYYGDRAGHLMREHADAGDDFLAEVCAAWEAAAAPATEAGIRVVQLRTGIVLSPKGGALKKMLTPFKMGVGGRIGSGDQWMSWISLTDQVGAIMHAIETDVLRGPVNAVAPNPVPNHEFTKTLGRVLKRPTIFPLPGLVAKLAFGEMADALLLASQRVEPERLKQTNYEFQHKTLEEALRAELGKN